MVNKIILLIIFSLYSVFSYSGQIEGLGVFKIGMSYYEFDRWLSENRVTVVLLNLKFLKHELFDNELGESDIKVVKVVDDGLKSWFYFKNRGNFSVNRLSKYDSYLVVNYGIGDLFFQPIELVFLNKKLVLVKTKLEDDLLAAINVKFGAPTSKRKYTRIKCVYAFTGATIREMYDIETKLTWSSRGRIDAHAEQYEYHNDECKKESTGTFFVEETGANSKYVSDNKRELNRIESSLKSVKDTELRKRLKDL